MAVSRAACSIRHSTVRCVMLAWLRRHIRCQKSMTRGPASAAVPTRPQAFFDPKSLPTTTSQTKTTFWCLWVPPWRPLGRFWDHFGLPFGRFGSLFRYLFDVFVDRCGECSRGGFWGHFWYPLTLANLSIPWGKLNFARIRAFRVQGFFSTKKRSQWRCLGRLWGFVFDVFMMFLVNVF